MPFLHGPRTACVFPVYELHVLFNFFENSYVAPHDTLTTCSNGHPRRMAYAGHALGHGGTVAAFMVRG